MGHRAPKGSAARRKGHVGLRTITMPGMPGGTGEHEEDDEEWLWEDAQASLVKSRG